jgi:RNA polymerase sigma-70 factor (ECF subfamily)
MYRDDPDETWQLQIHQRIIGDDPTAFSELCVRAIEPLVNSLMSSGKSTDYHLCQTIVHDALLEYFEYAQKYDPTKSPLFSYLRLMCSRDLLNALDKERRKNKKIMSIDDEDVAERVGGRNNVQEERDLDEWVESLSGQDKNEIIRDLKTTFNDTDWEIIQLWIIEGVRNTDRFAAVLQIRDQDIDTQRREVKKAKDRIMKKIIRFGNQKRREQ